VVPASCYAVVVVSLRLQETRNIFRFQSLYSVFALFNVHASHPYDITGHTKALMNLFANVFRSTNVDGKMKKPMGIHTVFITVRYYASSSLNYSVYNNVATVTSWRHMMTRVTDRL